MTDDINVTMPILKSKLANSVTKTETATVLCNNNSLVSLAQIITTIGGVLSYNICNLRLYQ